MSEPKIKLPPLPIPQAQYTLYTEKQAGGILFEIREVRGDFSKALAHIILPVDQTKKVVQQLKALIKLK